MRILYPGSKAQDTGDSKKHGLEDPHIVCGAHTLRQPTDCWGLTESNIGGLIARGFGLLGVDMRDFVVHVDISERSCWYSLRLPSCGPELFGAPLEQIPPSKLCPRQP